MLHVVKANRLHRVKGFYIIIKYTHIFHVQGIFMGNIREKMMEKSKLVLQSPIFKI